MNLPRLLKNAGFSKTGSSRKNWYDTYQKPMSSDSSLVVLLEVKGFPKKIVCANAGVRLERIEKTLERYAADWTETQNIGNVPMILWPSFIKQFWFAEAQHTEDEFWSWLSSLLAESEDYGDYGSFYLGYLSAIEYADHFPESRGLYWAKRALVANWLYTKEGEETLEKIRRKDDTILPSEMDALNSLLAWLKVHCPAVM